MTATADERARLRADCANLPDHAYQAAPAGVLLRLLDDVERAERERDDYRTGKQECWDKFVAERARAEAAERDRSTLSAEVEKLVDCCNRRMRECDAERARAERLERELLVAAGLISTMPGFSDKHPQDALDYVRNAAAEIDALAAPAPDAERAADK